MIDAHIHIFPTYRSKKAVEWIKRYIPEINVSETLTEEEIIETLASHGISHFFNYVYPLKPEESRSLNRFNYELSKKANNAICFGSVHPGNADRVEIVKEALLEFGLVGIKFHPFVQRFKVLDERMEEIYNLLEKLNRPVIFHTGFERFYKMRLAPEEIETIARRHSGLVIVVVHMFYPRIDRAFELVKKYENIYLDATNIFSCYEEPPSGENLFEATFVPEKNAYRIYFHHSVEELENYSHRVMFGSDYPVAMNNLDKIYACMRDSDISATAKENIMEKTAKGFVNRFKPGFFNPMELVKKIYYYRKEGDFL